MKFKLIFCDGTFRVFPTQKVSTIRWSIFATFVSVATFFIGLSIAMIGIQSTLSDKLVVLWCLFGFFMFLGILSAGYGVWLGYHYLDVGSDDPTATKCDLKKLETNLISRIDEALKKR